MMRKRWIWQALKGLQLAGEPPLPKKCLWTSTAFRRELHPGRPPPWYTVRQLPMTGFVSPDQTSCLP